VIYLLWVIIWIPKYEKKNAMAMFNSKFILHLCYNFEAIHNKDYSVVKTPAFPLALNQGDFLLEAIPGFFKKIDTCPPPPPRVRDSSGSPEQREDYSG
jgi:hypothetical protein